jgi:hypothetical protein
LPHRQPDDFVDGAFGVELRGLVRSSNAVDRHLARLKCVGQLPTKRDKKQSVSKSRQTHPQMRRFQKKDEGGKKNSALEWQLAGADDDVVDGEHTLFALDLDDQPHSGVEAFVSHD